MVCPNFEINVKLRHFIFFISELFKLRRQYGKRLKSMITKSLLMLLCYALISISLIILLAVTSNVRSKGKLINSQMDKLLLLLRYVRRPIRSGKQYEYFVASELI